MNFKFLGTLALATIFSISAYSQSQTPSEGTRSTHAEKHKELLASRKSNGLDKNTLNNIIQQDVAAREESHQLTGAQSKLIEDLLKEAQTHIGKRYVWGSKGPATFDCSGFTGYVYRQFGYNLGPCSREQYKIGKSIDKKHLRKGDLVFFTSPRSGSGVGHVGIVWEANNETGDFKFIHASTRGVKISNFEGYYVKRYIGAKRVIE